MPLRRDQRGFENEHEGREHLDFFDDARANSWTLSGHSLDEPCGQRQDRASRIRAGENQNESPTRSSGEGLRKGAASLNIQTEF